MKLKRHTYIYIIPYYGNLNSSHFIYLFFFPQELDIFSHGTLVHTCTCQPFKIAMVANQKEHLSI